MSEFNNQTTNEITTQYEEKDSAVVTIRCLSAVPVDLEKLLAEIESEEAEVSR